jgi:hypothetical protein
MPSTAGQADERSTAGQQGGKVYHLMAADASTDLSKHVGHEIEVTGTFASAGAGSHHGMSSSTGSTGSTATTSGGAAGGGSGSTGYTGPGTSGSGSTGSGAAGGAGATSAGSTSAVGSMASQAQAGMGRMLRVTSLKMIADTCK